MLFHSWIFAIFFAICFVVYLPLRRTPLWTTWLLLSSYFFYGWWNPLYLLLIIYSTALDYFVGLAIARSRRQGRWLVLSVANNLLLLGFFKYSDFVAQNFTTVLHSLRVPLDIPEPGILLPIGISFYTFQSMSYTIDLYRGRIRHETNFVRFALFVSFFPQLIAGPIERASDLLPQLKHAPRIKTHNITDGLSLFVVGLFKKVALADLLAVYVDQAYDAPAQASSTSLLLATYAFAWQIYFDFSGYSDMARGCAKVLGIKLSLNFANPYLATGLGDFWRRWHITLSTWFRDYLYVPLGGNRCRVWKLYRNIAITMVVAGLWHGAAWSFLAWGAMHTIGRFCTRHLEQTTFYRNRVPKFLKQIWVFHFLCLTWIFFRAESLADALTVVKGIGRGVWADPQLPIVAVLFCLCVIVYQWISESRIKYLLNYSPVKILMMLAMLVYLTLFTTSGYEPFIYFQF